MSDHHVRWSSINGEHLYVDHIYYMIHARPFGLSVPRPYLHMLGSSSLTRVFCVCKNWLAPVVCERRAYHPIITWCLGTTNCGNGAYSGRTLFILKFSERSSYNATAVLSKIRCINKINIACN